MTALTTAAPSEFPEIEVERSTMNGKPVFNIDVKTVMNFKSGFAHKRLCTGFTFSLGSACAYDCAFCYSGLLVRRHPEIVRLLAQIESRGLTLPDIVVRRRNAEWRRWQPHVARVLFFGVVSDAMAVIAAAVRVPLAALEITLFVHVDVVNAGVAAHGDEQTSDRTSGRICRSSPIHGVRRERADLYR